MDGLLWVLLSMDSDTGGGCLPPSHHMEFLAAKVLPGTEPVRPHDPQDPGIS